MRAKVASVALIGVLVSVTWWSARTAGLAPELPGAGRVVPIAAFDPRGRQDAAGLDLGLAHVYRPHPMDASPSGWHLLPPRGAAAAAQ